MTRKGEKRKGKQRLLNFFESERVGQRKLKIFPKHDDGFSWWLCERWWGDALFRLIVDCTGSGEIGVTGVEPKPAMVSCA